MKNMPDTFSIDFACLQISRFETVILNSFWDIPQIKTVKPPDKKPSISDRYSFLRRRSVKFQFVWQKRCYNIPLAELLQKHVDLRIHPQNAKIPSCVCARCALWYDESVRFIETTTSQSLVSVSNLN